MNKILLFLILLIAPTAIAQVVIKGVIKDTATQQPVEAATISADGSNIATISNSDGNFRIILPEGSKGITISHLSYKTYTVAADATGKELEIFVEPAGIELEEVVVANKPVDAILSDIISNSKSHLEKSLLLNTYYREFIKVNGSYTKFADGLLDFYVKRKSGSSDLEVMQSRSFRLKDAGESQREQLADAMYLFDVREAITYAYGFKGITRLLSDKNYDYQLKMRTDTQGRSVEIITVTPKPGITEVMYVATVIYDPVKKLILDMDIKCSEEHKKYSEERNLIIFKFTLLDVARKTSFKVDGDKYILTYNKTRANFHFKMKNRLDDTFDFLSDNIVMDYKEGEFTIDKKQRYKEKSLFAAGTHFTTEYWKTSNTLLLTDAEEKIIKNFE